MLAQNAPSWPQSSPGRPQRGPKTGSEQGQDVSMIAQDASKMTHAGGQDCPKESPTQPQDKLKMFTHVLKRGPR